MSGQIKTSRPGVPRTRAMTPDDLGRVIRDRRQRLGLDQAALARKVGVSRQWIVEIERGKKRAEMGLILKTLAALGLELTLKPVEARSRPDEELFAPGMIDLDAVVDRARGRQ